MRWLSLFVLIFFLTSPQLYSQQQLITMHGKGVAELPFTYVNNFIVVDIVFNERFPLKFIFDTGAENTILTHREITDLLEVDYQRKITLYGADFQSKLFAYVAPGIHMGIGQQLTIAEQAILVLEEDYFSFEEITGMTIHGILGADILRRFIIKIDYRRRKIIFQDPSTFKPPRFDNFIVANSEFHRYKPYLNLPTALRAGNTTEQKYLLDTGASLALLMYTSSDSSLLLPEHLIYTAIGFGIGGILEGYIGRTASLGIGELELQNIITNFQDMPLEYAQNIGFLNDRNGLIGNVVLQRFYVIIDYIHEKVYLRPNRDFKRKFSFDRSGLSIAATGNNLNHYIVLTVIEDSPADLVGIQKGDEIRTVNGVPVLFKGLESIVRSFQKKPGRKVQLLIKRGEERMVVEFRLRDLI